MKIQGSSWEVMKEMECQQRRSERERRNRLITQEDPRVHQEPFASAPYMHKNNEPKYHAMLLRAAEHAKQQRLHTLWFTAKDTAEDPKQLADTPEQLTKKHIDLLHYHDQKTAGIPGLTPLYKGMKGRVTEKIGKVSRIEF